LLSYETDSTAEVLVDKLIDDNIRKNFTILTTYFRALATNLELIDFGAINLSDGVEIDILGSTFPLCSEALIKDCSLDE